MPITLEDKMKKLNAARRKKVEARAAQLIAQEMSLRDLRKALSLTQERLAARLKVSQDRISRMERRTDLLISTLRRHVAAMGGNLSLVAEFPDREPVILAGLANMDAERPSTSRREAGRAGKTHRY
jgi:transcriptional regulator with XRE-family HTH domain